MSGTIAANLADYLEGAAYWSPLTDVASKARWGDLGRASSFVSPIDAKADTDAEVTRQLDFLKHPHVEERVQVPETGIRDQLRGRCVTIRAAAAGYEGGALCFVLGGDENRSEGFTVLHVLRRLAS